MNQIQYLFNKLIKFKSAKFLPNLFTIRFEFNSFICFVIPSCAIRMLEEICILISSHTHTARLGCWKKFVF